MNKIVTNASIATRVGLAIVDIKLTLNPHVSRGTGTAEIGLEVVTGCSIEARIRGASIGFVLAIGPPISVLTKTSMGGSDILTTAPVLAEAGN